MLVSLPFLYVLENWRGERALARAVARLQAAGETLDFSRLWPPTPPREENFCATPALDGIAGMVDDDREAGEPGAQRARLMILPFGFPEAERDIGLFKQTFSPIDWEEWRAALQRKPPPHLPLPAGEPDPAKAILAALAPHQALFDELAAAARSRPRAQFTPPLAETAPHTGEKGGRLTNMAMPHFDAVRLLMGTIRLRGRAALAVGELETARECRLVLSRLAEACAQGGSIDHFAIGQWGEDFLTDLCWDGIRLRVWTEDDYRLMAARDLADRSKPQLLTAMRLELAYEVEKAEFYLIEKGMLAALDGRGAVIHPRFPRGWLRQNQAYAINWFLDDIILPLKNEGPLALPRRRDDVEGRASRIYHGRLLRHYAILPSIALPGCVKIAVWHIHSATLRRLAAVAVAVERYYLAHGRYPETLAALTPDFLTEVPVDLDGQPFRYAPDPANGRYRLWSVGLNGVDDWQGTPPARSKKITDRDALDWVWMFPAGDG